MPFPEPQPDHSDLSTLPITMGVTRLEAEIQADNLLDDLQARLQDDNADWRRVLFETMAEWPLPDETTENRKYVYLIEGEAFDWRALAERMLEACEGRVSWEDRGELLLGGDPPDGITDEEFSHLLGVQKHRAYMNYLYGVTVERGLILAVEEQIRKRRVSRGYSPSDDRVDDSYIQLYKATYNELAREYSRARAEAPETIETAESSKHPKQRQSAATTTPSMSDDDAFAYWLFKRRFRVAEPVRLASDTRKALEQLERMRVAHVKRERALRAFQARQERRK